MKQAPVVGGGCRHSIFVDMTSVYMHMIHCEIKGKATDE